MPTSKVPGTEPMLSQCWATFYGAGSVLDHVSFFLGCYGSEMLKPYSLGVAWIATFTVTLEHAVLILSPNSVVCGCSSTERQQKAAE